MTISYNWLCDYLPVQPEPERVSKILTAIGLEVESLEKYESVKGRLQGLIIGEVLTCEQHPNADKLKITTVETGGPEPLQIVCGAQNVAAGQKVVIAPVGTTIYPVKGEPVTMKVAKIRGIESFGMICAEDEIGLGESHEGILVLPNTLRVGIPAAEYFKPYTDFIFEIGLTPNHMDAMSHLGVARDVCAYLSHQDKKETKIKTPSLNAFRSDNQSVAVTVSIQNKSACQRFSGVTLRNLTIRDSPKWMQDKLRAIGIRPINNVVDITNFVLQETGQPLHAYDLGAVTGHKIEVKTLPEGTPFVTLDGKERKLSAEDLMVCNAEIPMCIAGVFGGLQSGVNDGTKEIFLESAWFHPSWIRKTSLRHNLRTDAAAHFEKGMDISQTVQALKRAALLMKEFAGAEIASDIIDVYAQPKEKVEVTLKNHYLKKLSGKNYHPDAVKRILQSLGFEILKEGMDDLRVAVPFHKTDIALPADLVEEIMRIDGYDHIEIPTGITISPSVENGYAQAAFRNKAADYLVGSGFHEIFTNSITNSAYFNEEELAGAVKMINNLSAELNIMRPSLLETGLESIAWNINRKNADLRFFEFGKTYRQNEPGNYTETNHLCLYITGQTSTPGWKAKAGPADFYYLKGICNNLFELLKIEQPEFITGKFSKIQDAVSWTLNEKVLAECGKVKTPVAQRFGIKQPVYFLDIRWDNLLEIATAQTIEFRELPRQLPAERDLALIVEKSLSYEKVEKSIHSLGLNKLQNFTLFDIFESGKLGTGKKSLALNFIFLDGEKTLTDKEIDSMMDQIMRKLEDELKAEIRK